MKKFSRTRNALIIWLLIPIFTGILVVVINQISNFNMFWNPNMDVASIFFMILLFITNFALIIRILPRYKQKELEVVLILLCFLLCSGLAGIFSASWSLFSFENEQLNFFWLSTTTFMLFPGLFFLYYFNIELFWKGLEFGHNKRNLIIFSLYLFFMEFLNVFNILMSFKEQWFYVLNILLLAVVGLYSTGMLAWSGFIVSNKIVEPIPSRGIKLIGYAGLTNTCAFIFNLIHNLIYTAIESETQPLLWLSWMAWSVGSVLLYFGITLPITKAIPKSENS